MGRNIPQTGAPIPEQSIEQIADSYGHDSEDFKEAVETAQAIMDDGIEHYREHRVVAESNDLLVVLSQYHLRHEAEEVDEVIDLPSDLREDLPSMLSEAHHDAFHDMSHLTGLSSQEATNALSANYPRVIYKHGDAKLSATSVTFDYQLQYDHGYEQPFHFVARARARVDGQYGPLQIKRTYRAVPDDNSDEDRNEIHVTSEATHAGSDTIVSEWTDVFALDEEIHTGHGRITEDDHALRNWVYENHTADFEAEYEAIERSLPICDECGAYPTDHVTVDQRSTHQFDPSTPDMLCNHCYAQLLTDVTTLAPQEAEVYALIESGLSHRQVAAAIGSVSRSQVGTVMGRVKDKRSKAEQEREQAKRTAELIDE